MPTFKNPVYSKKLNSKSGISEPCYTFPIIFCEDEGLINISLDENQQITLQHLQKCILENVDWWNIFISEFLQASSKHFAKTYTVESINKIVKHSIISHNISDDWESSADVFFIPKEIQIHGGIFTVNWHYDVKSVIIKVPELTFDEEEAVDNTEVKDTETKDETLLPVLDEIQELNIEEIPGNKNETIDLSDPSRYYERQRVREARLKAKLAIYKAQIQTSKYYEKYGADISDSDDSSEYYSSDEETEDEDEI